MANNNKNEENSMEVIKAAYINYMKTKPPVTQIDCQFIPRKEKTQEGKKD